MQIAGQAMMALTLSALARMPGLAATRVVLAPDGDLFEAAVPEFVGECCWLAALLLQSRA